MLYTICSAVAAVSMLTFLLPCMRWLWLCVSLIAIVIMAVNALLGFMIKDADQPNQE